MKKFLIAIMIFFIYITSIQSETRYIDSSDKEGQINIARITKMIQMPKTSGVDINFYEVDIGGSTDLSPTKEIYFTLYKKGEMFSTDASFLLGYFFSLESATKINSNKYKIFVVGRDEHYYPTEMSYIIDSRKAFDALQKVDCGNEFDCKDSESFQTIIAVEGKYNDPAKDFGRVEKSSIGIVYGLDPRGEGFLSVRNAPNSSAKEVGRIYNGDSVEIIDKKGKWYNIKYGNKYGWAHSNWIKAQ